MTLQDIKWTIRFTRLFKGNLLALDIIEYLINNNEKYVGSYYTLADELRGDVKAASNIRKACMWLREKNLICVQSTHGNDNYCTVITMNADWMDNI